MNEKNVHPKQRRRGDVWFVGEESGLESAFDKVFGFFRTNFVNERTFRTTDHSIGEK